jgi:hypothetical protein
MTPVRCSLGPILALFLGAGCSFVDPQAGAAQAACGISGGGASQTGPGAAYYGTPTTQTTKSGAPTCATVPMSPCDDCESTHCCATRSACYGDPVCACADAALDECLDQAATGASTDVTRCWDLFAAKGTVEQARVACQRSWCQTECKIP